MAAIGNALRISDCSHAENLRLGKYPKINGSQAPQIKNSSTIMINKRNFIGTGNTPQVRGGRGGYE
jgi:hypothetical protein